MTYREAYAALPAEAKWSSSFGNPGEGGFVEFYREPNGTRWKVSNGPWCGPEAWMVERETEEG